LGLHLRSFVTATKTQPSLNHNLKSVPLVLTGDSVNSQRLSPSDDREAHKKAFQRARLALLTSDLIEVTDDCVSVARKADMDWPDDSDNEI
jgi:hypothetical protein